MIINGSQKVGEAKVFETAREMEQQKKIDKLEAANRVLMENLTYIRINAGNLKAATTYAAQAQSEAKRIMNE